MSQVFGGEGMQQLMQKASKLKEIQLRKLNKDWYAAPDFFKRTLYHFKEHKYHELEDVNEKYELSLDFKAKGNKAFAEKDWQNALDQYTLGLSPFLYFSQKEDDDRMPLNDETTTLSARKED